MTNTSRQSAVTSLFNQIEGAYRAAKHGLTGFVVSATHAALTSRMEQIGRFHAHGHIMVGDNAIRLIAERFEALPEK